MSARKPLDPRFLPTKETVSFLKEFKGIPPAFAIDLLPAFVHFHCSNQHVASSWELRFIKHCEYRFDQYKNSRAGKIVSREEAEGKLLPKDFKPTMTRISVLIEKGLTPDFIQEQLTAFKLFFGSAQYHSAEWDKKFAEYASRKWSQSSVATNKAVA